MAQLDERASSGLSKGDRRQDHPDALAEPETGIDP
jgi:hypothetical protein